MIGRIGRYSNTTTFASTRITDSDKNTCNGPLFLILVIKLFECCHRFDRCFDILPSLLAFIK